MCDKKRKCLAGHAWYNCRAQPWTVEASMEKPLKLDTGFNFDCNKTFDTMQI